MVRFNRFPHGGRAVPSLAVTLLIGLAGCQEKPKITAYTAPPDANLDTGPEVEGPPTRTLAAAVYLPEAAWFFKMMGEIEDVGSQQKEFGTLLDSLKPKGSDLEWKSPEGWAESKGTGFRIATLKPPGGLKPEIAITRLEGSGGTPLANVNRWRGELSLPDLKEKDLAAAVTEKKVNGLTIQVVDMTGKKKARSAMGGMGGQPPMARNTPPVPQPGQVTSGAKEAANKLTYSLPSGWKESDKKVMFAAKVLEVSDSPSIRITLSPLKPDGNSVGDNVNRWRAQLGLAPEDSKTLEKTLAREKIADGEEAMMVDLAGKGPMGPQRLLGAIIRKPDALWFVKLTGDPAEATKAQAGFVELVRSLKFN